MTVGLTACNLGNSTSPGGVAVLDLDKVGKSIGRLNLIAKKVKQYRGQQQAGLIKLRDKLRVRVAKLKKELGEKPTAKQIQAFKQQSLAAENQLQKAKNKVNQQVKQFKANQIVKFQKDARPVAEKVAAANGFSVVMFRQSNLLWVDPAVDITDAVSKAMSATAVN